MTSPLNSLPTWVLSSAATRSHQILHRRLKEAGFTGYEYRCLATLAVDDQISQAELGAATSLDPRDVTHTVRSLGERGFVERAKDPRYGRRMLVSLTPEGREAAAVLAEVMAGIQDEVFAQLSDKQRSTLVELLSRVA